jgi:hypothetical protein
MTSIVCFFWKYLPKNKIKYFVLQDTPFPFHDVSHAHRHVVLITAPVRSPLQFQSTNANGKFLLGREWWRHCSALRDEMLLCRILHKMAAAPWRPVIRRPTLCFSWFLLAFENFWNSWNNLITFPTTGHLNLLEYWTWGATVGWKRG